MDRLLLSCAAYLSTGIHVATAASSTSPVKAWAYTNEDDAVTMVERLLSTGGDGLKNLTNTPETQPPQPARKARTKT